MLSINRATILGHLTRDPELRYTPNGQAVANFGMATNRRFKTQTGEFQEQTEFHDIVAWGKLAETTNQMLKKGAPAYIEGRLQTRSWEAPDGTKRYRTEIVAQMISALSPRGSMVEGGTPTEVAADTPAAEPAPTASSEPTQATPTKKTKPAKTDDQAEQEINLDEIPF